MQLTLGNGGSILATVDLSALAGVILERMPSGPIVHALEYGHRVGLGVAELQTDVGQFILFAQVQGDGDILT